MEKISFLLDGQDKVEFFVLEQTRLGGVNYLLVTDKEEGDADALILKDTSKEGDAEGVYEIVSDDKELAVVAEIFEDMLEDVAFVTEDEN
ncbi:MAG: DUF1292 domain-containing protein [Lachnospiraceae bacterium]|nr:DUF1292 domain-containing protein [Lachnospiraceae bacterium]